MLDKLPWECPEHSCPIEVIRETVGDKRIIVGYRCSWCNRELGGPNIETNTKNEDCGGLKDERGT